MKGELSLAQAADEAGLTFAVAINDKRGTNININITLSSSLSHT